MRPRPPAAAGSPRGSVRREAAGRGARVRAWAGAVLAGVPACAGVGGACLLGGCESLSVGPSLAAFPLSDRFAAGDDAPADPAGTPDPDAAVSPAVFETLVKGEPPAAGDPDGGNPAGDDSDGGDAVRTAAFDTDAIPEPEPRSLALGDAVARALTFNRRLSVVRLGPAETRANVDAAAAAFDPVMSAGAVLRRSDEQVASSLAAFGPNIDSIGSRSLSAADGTTDTFAVTKRWEAGTVTRVGLGTGYDRTDPAGSFLVVNPALRTGANVTVEQPLLRGRGRRANRLGIAVAGAEHRGRAGEVAAAVLETVRDVHTAYWRLVLARADDADLVELLADAEAARDREAARLRHGDGSAAAEALARAGVARLKGERAEAKRRVRRTSAELAEAVGLPPGGRTELIPADSPPSDPAAFPPLEPAEVEAGVARARAGRPDLLARRSRMLAARLTLERAEQGLKPQLNLTGRLGVTGLGDAYGRSLSSVTTGDYGAWSVGMNWQRSFGMQAERAAVEGARAALLRERAALTAAEAQVEDEVRRAADALADAGPVLAAARERLTATADRYAAERALYDAGQTDLDRLDRARRDLRDARRASRTAAVSAAEADVTWRAATGDLVG